ncbi:rho guanine nucleotide exchange factor 33-like isoform X1 [Leucoraja erinacea]|uniref:rho guanine nucleotide exchange factor 33-like isoform X1 n=2 Tax=Leucoraja erinaceus TaxID=7782 RepID=UPI002454A529|nr:rho guanine nucleotide exchange factor 33-like isoform X1 [Leucoraja erinacea]
MESLSLSCVERVSHYLFIFLVEQNVLRHTEPKHPDCYLLPICIQHFRIFLSQCSHLLRYNEELLKQRRKHTNRHRMTAVQQTKTRGTEQIQCPRLDETPSRHKRLDKLDHGLLCTSDLGLEYRSPPAKVASKTEPLPRKTKDEFNVSKTRSTFSQPDKSSIITNPKCSSVNCGKNLSPDTHDLMYGASRGKTGYESPVDLEDAEYIHEASCLVESSVPSSNSSLDVHFTKTLDYISASESQAIDYPSQLTATHPAGQEDHNKEFRLHCHEANIDLRDVPKSKGFSSKVFTPAPRDYLNFPVSLMLTNSDSPSLKTKVFDSSQISTSRMKNSQKEISASYKSKASDVWMESEKDNSAMVLAFEKSGKFYKEEESKQTAFSEQSGKQEQKGFRNSFRKLFRKKSNQNACSLESKQKSDHTHAQDTAIAGSQEAEDPAVPVSTFDRGTAV